jgi:DNA polymerase (family 10)
MSDKKKWPREEAMKVAEQLCRILKPICDRLIVAGSLRRQKETVGDIEILYIPKYEPRQIELFISTYINLADEGLDQLMNDGVIEPRKNVRGAETYGPKNKYTIHRASGLPVDFFSATEENWWNYLVCRTGPKESNIRISAQALQRGWEWKPYSSGFSKGGPLFKDYEEHAVTSEKDVFEFVGLPYLKPELRR